MLRKRRRLRAVRDLVALQVAQSQMGILVVLGLWSTEDSFLAELVAHGGQNGYQECATY